MKFLKNGHGKSWKSHGVSFPDLCGNPVPIYICVLRLKTSFTVNSSFVIRGYTGANKSKEYVYCSRHQCSKG